MFLLLSKATVKLLIILLFACSICSSSLSTSLSTPVLFSVKAGNWPKTLLSLKQGTESY